MKVMDLFAGCGGLSLGLEQAGFEPVFVNELNKDARDTYVLNRQDRLDWFKRAPDGKDSPFEIDDVKKMVADAAFLRSLQKRFKSDFGIHHGELDLIVGGPPCQGFSGIGHRRSYAVDKEHLPSNHLYQDMKRVIEVLQPRAFLFENVRGLLNAKWNGEGRRIWPDVLDEFKRLDGYSVAYQLVFAKDYGVPQNRPRVLMVGIRDDVQADIVREGDDDKAVARRFLPEPTGNAPDLETLLGDLVDPSYEPGMKATTLYPRAASKWVAEVFRPHAPKKGQPVSEHEYSIHRPEIVQKFRAMHANGGVVPEQFRTKKFAQRVLPKKWDTGGPCITATSLADDYVHFSQPRVLTVREWARLQMFPDWYRFAGKRTTGGIRRAGNPREGIFDREVPKYTQIGNAVPVGLARAVGEHLKKVLGT